MAARRRYQTDEEKAAADSAGNRRRVALCQERDAIGVKVFSAPLNRAAVLRHLIAVGHAHEKETLDDRALKERFTFWAGEFFDCVVEAEKQDLVVIPVAIEPYAAAQRIGPTLGVSTVELLADRRRFEVELGKWVRRSLKS